MICDGYRRLTIGCRGRNHILDPGRTVEHRILGVDVEVCDGITRLSFTVAQGGSRGGAV